MNRSPEHARLLLQKARDEANLLTRWVEDATVPAWLMGFHAQQALEKALKAVLADRGFEYPLTHNLGWLLDLVRRQAIEDPPDAAEIPRLTPFGTTFRYVDEPDGGTEFLLDRAWAAACVSRTIRWADAVLNAGIERE